MLDADERERLVRQLAAEFEPQWHVFSADVKLQRALWERARDLRVETDRHVKLVALRYGAWLALGQVPADLPPEERHTWLRKRSIRHAKVWVLDRSVMHGEGRSDALQKGSRLDHLNRTDRKQVAEYEENHPVAPLEAVAEWSKEDAELELLDALAPGWVREVLDVRRDHPELSIAEACRRVGVDPARWRQWVRRRKQGKPVRPGKRP